MKTKSVGITWSEANKPGSIPLRRRGYHVGYVVPTEEVNVNSACPEPNEPIFLPAMLAVPLVAAENDLKRSNERYRKVLSGDSLEDVFADALDRLDDLPGFEYLSASYDESDRQQIERLDFDVVLPDSVEPAEVWLKASWLSYEEQDQSLRFRFSFGMDGYEQVGDFPQQSRLAAQLAGAFFPECSVLTSSQVLVEALQSITGQSDLSFVERIVYFNAPDGGAQFHQDVEPGHFGIIYAQMTGSTVWLALSKDRLVNYIQAYLRDRSNLPELKQMYSAEELAKLLGLSDDKVSLGQTLDSRQDLVLDRFVNQCAGFNRLLVENNHAFLLRPGDVIWLPQKDLTDCAWHSVFCANKHAGEALSFAVRT